MRLISATIAAALACASAAAYAADEATPSPTPSEGEAQAEKPKKICRMETSTGSVMPKRVCRTPEQAAADQEAAQRAREQMNRNRGM